MIHIYILTTIYKFILLNSPTIYRFCTNIHFYHTNILHEKPLFPDTYYFIHSNGR